MYKATYDSLHFLKKAASHSTKGTRSGRVDILPPEAQPTKETYLSARDQLDILKARDEFLREQIQSIKIIWNRVFTQTWSLACF
jgi:hypothetical protein